MTSERFEKIRNLFEEALERPSDQRTAFLQQACGEDRELAAEVQRMLIADAQLESPIDLPAMAGVGSLLTPELFNLEGRRIGPYLVQERIGAGGMGVVYHARRDDRAFQKEVAIKIASPSLARPEIVKRFQQEREILASLDHPHIARLLDGGGTPEGLPYLVMDYVPGIPITRWCDERRLGIRARISLFRTVCSAVQYAHQKLIVHRDLKPSNILVTEDGTVKLLDFGIAKLLASHRPETQLTLTQEGTLLMTPEYASPE
jgi:serine/threonine protein kinase